MSVYSDINTQHITEDSLLLALSKDITSCRTKADVEDIVRKRLSGFFQFNEITICLNNPDNATHMNYIHALSEETLNQPDFADGIAMKYDIHDGIYNVIQAAEEAVIFEMEELVRRRNKPPYVDFFARLHVRELIGFPIRVNNESFGAAFVYVKGKREFTESQLKLAQAVCSQISIAVSNIRAFEKIQDQLEEINRYKLCLEGEIHYLQEQINTVYNYNEIVGSGEKIKKVFDLMERVAPSDSTVLLLGETGTGKELIARAIHNNSPRKDRVMIKVNCAVLPSNLVESELFGHEKGSFTGAIERRIGKFELANNSTLFLDEIGEMPLELQSKLLRALQEREIERVGGKSVIKTNVRIIAATNRNLQEEVAGGRFRSDLFYRLNVFPISIPPLRERKEDIPILAGHFIKSLSQKISKKIDGISQRALEQMSRYDWPGNVRELEHVIERSMLLTAGDSIREVHIPGTGRARAVPEPVLLTDNIKTLNEHERDYILAILKKSNGKVRGPGGAAELLKIPPTTLHSKMKKLGILKSGR